MKLVKIAFLMFVLSIFSLQTMEPEIMQEASRVDLRVVH